MKKIFFYTISLIIIIFSIYYFFYNNNLIVTKINNNLSISLSNNKTISLLGIYIPNEKKNNAKIFLEKLLMNKKVFIKYDYTIPYPFYDKYIYLYTVQNDTSINELLIKNKYAICRSPFPFTKFYIFKNLEKKCHLSKKTKTKNKNIKLSNPQFYIANKSSKTIHKPDCKFAKKMKNSNKVIFKNLQDALKKGYKKCRICF